MQCDTPKVWVSLGNKNGPKWQQDTSLVGETSWKLTLRFSMTSVKRTVWPPRPIFGKFCPKLAHFLGRKSKFLDFTSYPSESLAAGEAGEVDRPNYRILAKSHDLFSRFWPETAKHVKIGHFDLIRAVFGSQFAIKNRPKWERDTSLVGETSWKLTFRFSDTSVKRTVWPPQAILCVFR